MQQNLGSLVRSAFFLGAAGVLCCARNSAPLSPAVAKASSGALEMLPLHSCTNLMRTLQTASECRLAGAGCGPLPRVLVLQGWTVVQPVMRLLSGFCACCWALMQRQPLIMNALDAGWLVLGAAPCLVSLSLISTCRRGLANVCVLCS